MNYYETVELPYALFLALLKQARLSQIMESPAGREAIEKGKRLTQTKPDLVKIRNQDGYTATKIEK